MKNLIPFLVLFANVVLTVSDCTFTDEIEIHVINRLPFPQLRFHCASGDDDLGYHNVNPNYDFHWKFCTDFVPSTLFFCHLWWNNKDVSFDVFSTKTYYRCLEGKCYWEARTDGIYFADGEDPTQFRKAYNWN
ncbi:hypothetical protein ABFX02_06G188000 [Erythranthe guttata]